ncbi:trans-sulfuration enzyme family protein [Rothia sp. CCM 9418]|uniref:trans-sulfuration enzyme family protein n=1 Tax=Rothia sp. CCM 9418 TaxID=3402661 RepID=UPI003AE43423
MAGFTTRAIHAVHNLEKNAIVPPIYLASTFIQPSDGTPGEYEYQRGSNPTRTAVETTLAQLENAQYSYVYSSGMGASSAALGLVRNGETLLMGMPSYGGNYRFATIELPKRGAHVKFIADFTTLSDEDFSDNVTMVFLETPTNPTLKVSDITRISQIAHRNGAIVVVDNTFLTPYLQRPLELGADITVQSATKYLSGHADLLGGVASTNNPELAEELHKAQLILGGILPPADSYRLLQNVKTLGLRLERQQENAQRLIQAIKKHPAVDCILYPGSASAEETKIQSQQAQGQGAVFSFILAEGHDIQKFIEALNIFSFAVSLGGIESLVCLPATMTQGAYTQEHLDMFGVHPRLIRVAVGIEDYEDLLEDFTTALNAS